ncbi:Cation transporter family protein [Teladorsagia circumcincta]|uniref:Cation transporter family protein n=1 Tax=Teladorsagia circumcincta TaxID=45464 RepID=A0A2G9UF89_TELCI|nr:Cation transporter family protein [Teladorsagia circumcincta]
MWLLYFTFCLAITQAKIYNHLFETLLGRYNRLVRPAVDANDTIRIEFKLKLSQIVDVHAKHQTLTANGWLIHHWYDHRLSWKPEDYGGIKNFYVPGEIIWLPDIILYNNAHGSPWVSAITKAHVYYDGRVTWEPPIIYHSFCTMNVEWYPYDIQQCELKFGSWTYSGTQLDLMHLLSDDVKYVVRKNESEWDVERGVDVSAFQESVEWDLLSVLGTRHEKWYPCCDYPSIDITYYLQIRRKKLFYTVNLIVPCASLAALTSWVFYLPCESHQKVQLCISVLVSLTVFFLLLVEIIPPTSIVLPLIVKYLTFTMFMVSLSVALTVFVQNIHFRTANFPISDRIRRIFIDTLGRKLLLSRATEEANFHRKAQHSKQISALSAMSILQKQFHKTVFEIEMATKAKKPMSTVNSLFLELPMMNRSMSVKPPAASSPSKLNRGEKLRRKTSINTVRSFDGSQHQKIRRSDSNVRNKLRRAERNVLYIAETLTEQRQAEEAHARNIKNGPFFLARFCEPLNSGARMALTTWYSSHFKRPLRPTILSL